ncbi:hypothetical protein OB69_09765 [Roseivirga seohaensis subsp. aquiponti]|uniref:NAD(P)-binding domain-containing protein n=1 Tax=Roseivirga seohaensis subsp. aquiponti TaxID=1566026 RepID=A0A0L8AJK9_9BACT|nr:NAD(P)H-binding protein [Roseivirga seohaensis]KOF02608.1 hypothetical protein OB69_09765 [Roseivirga seohaensis subsp. aquiponti]
MKVSIVGCGWLGLALGRRLAEEGFAVMGSTTSKEKFDLLSDAGINPFLLKMDPMPTGENFNALFQTDVLVINIPPGRKKNTPEFYGEQIKYLKYLADQHKVSRVIFVSSTSYYPNTGDWVTETTNFDLENGSTKAVVLGEREIRQVEAKLTVLRCGGLMGEDRVPGKWFAGKVTSGASTPVNYIHRDDVINIIQQLIKGDLPEEGTLNLVCPEHPTRKEVHEAMAHKYNFDQPIWEAPERIDSKKVSGKKLTDLGYSFLKPTPLDF